MRLATLIESDAKPALYYADRDGSPIASIGRACASLAPPARPYASELPSPDEHELGRATTAITGSSTPRLRQAFQLRIGHLGGADRDLYSRTADVLRVLGPASAGYRADLEGARAGWLGGGLRGLRPDFLLRLVRICATGAEYDQQDRRQPRRRNNCDGRRSRAIAQPSSLTDVTTGATFKHHAQDAPRPSRM